MNRFMSFRVHLRKIFIPHSIKQRGTRRNFSATSCRMTTPTAVKITSPVFRSLFTPELKALAELFKNGGYELRIAGGAVRDILMNIIPADIDFATTATPTEMKALFTKNEIRMINAGGEKHGTVTARINDRENYEITTLRIDKVTDGRHAEVEFTQDWVVDANRRDLTINSMFLDLEGNLYDHFGGLEDLLSRSVRFVGDPDKRIQEDFLRILRYFRFFGRISNDPNVHEPDTLNAIRRNADGLKRISGERLWTELRRIVVGRFADSVIRTMMEDVKLGPYLGLPEKVNFEEMEAVWKKCHHLNPKPMTIVSSMLKSVEEVEQMDARLKLANEECGLGFFLIRHRANPSLTDPTGNPTGNPVEDPSGNPTGNPVEDPSGNPSGDPSGDPSGNPVENPTGNPVEDPSGDPVVPYKRLFAEEILKTKPTDAKNWCLELLKYRGDSLLLHSMEEWEVPRFPVKSSRVREMKEIDLRQTNAVMQALRTVWVKSNFRKTEEELLTFDLPLILHNLAHQKVGRGPSFKKQKKERNKNL